MKHAKLVAKFKAEVIDRVTIDELEDTEGGDPFALAIGWAMGQGMTFKKAHEFALYVHYDLKYLGAW